MAEAGLWVTESSRVRARPTACRARGCRRNSTST